MKLFATSSSLIVVLAMATSAHAQVPVSTTTDVTNTMSDGTTPQTTGPTTGTAAKKKKKKKTLKERYEKAEETPRKQIDAEPTTLPGTPGGETTSGAPIPERPEKKADIDDEITNAKLRAQTGAKRQLSFQSTVNYNGSSIGDPMSSERPKLSPGTIAAQPSNLSGSVAAKYRLTEHDHLSLGIGVVWERPLHHGTTGVEYGEVADPYLAYNRLFKAGPLQNVFEMIAQGYTNRYSTSVNDAAEFDIDHTIVWAIPKSSWQLGLNVAYTHDFFSSTGASLANGGGDPVDEIAAYPYVEYEFNDRFSFRTVYRGLTYFNTTADTSTFTRDIPTESLGVGIAVTRDIYLYPNLQWVWSAISASRTNVALSANINL